MKDATVRGNGLAEVTLPFSCKDTSKPTVTSSYVTAAGATIATDTVTFYFSEAMDSSTLRNLSNYVYGGNSFATVSDCVVKSVADDAKSIVFTYPNAVALLTGNATVYAIKDVAGNMMVTNSTVAKYVAAPIAFTSAKATATNKIEVTYSKAIYLPIQVHLLLKKA